MVLEHFNYNTHTHKGVNLSFDLADQNEGAAGCAIRGSNPGRSKRLFRLQNSRPAVEDTQRPIRWVPGLFPGGKAIGA